MNHHFSGNTSSSESSSDEELDNCQTLTDIASGCTASAITGDFFGDGELAGLGVEHLISLEGGGIGTCLDDAQGNTSQDWAIPTEAFEQRQVVYIFLMMFTLMRGKICDKESVLLLHT